MRAAMRVLQLLLCIAACSAATAPSPVLFAIDSGTVVSHQRPEFLSTTIDVSLLTHQEHCDLTSDRLANMATVLQGNTSTWLRISGTKIDKMYMDMSPHPITTPPPGYIYVMNHTTWDGVGQFAARTGLSLVMGVNAGPGPRGDNCSAPWQPDVAAAMMKYTYTHGYDVVGWEFSNEPNMYPTVPDIHCALKVERYAADLVTWSGVVKSHAPAGTLRIVPDANFIPLVGDFLYLEELLPVAAQAHESWDVVTWHFYPTFSPVKYNTSTFPSSLRHLLSTPQVLLEPSVLDQVGFWADTVDKAVAAALPAGTEVWLGETGSAVGGGAPNVSDVFVDTLELIDKLGQLSSRPSNTLMFRQTLCGYNYGLIGFDLQPRPSFFTFALFKSIVGNASVAVTGGGEPLVRAYAYVGKNSRDVVATVVNLGNATVSVSFGDVLPGGSTPAAMDVHMLTAPTLTSSTMLHNGEPLTVNADGTLPHGALTPTPLPNVTSHVVMPEHSAAFVVWRAA